MFPLAKPVFARWSRLGRKEDAKRICDPGERRMFKKNDWIFGLISILIGVFVLVNIRDLLKVSNSMDPAGPAALPSIIAWAMVAIGLVHIATSMIMIRREKGKGKTETLPRRERKSLTPVVLITLASAVFIACLSSVGYPIAMPLLIAAIMLSVGVRDVKKIAITSIVTTLILFVSFSFGLNVDLPLGILKRFF